MNIKKFAEYLLAWINENKAKINEIEKTYVDASGGWESWMQVELWYYIAAREKEGSIFREFQIYNSDQRVDFLVKENCYIDLETRDENFTYNAIEIKAGVNATDKNIRSDLDKILTCPYKNITGNVIALRNFDLIHQTAVNLTATKIFHHDPFRKKMNKQHFPFDKKYF